MPFQWESRALRAYAENQVALAEAFKMADSDKDGVVNGGDAVKFFRQSGLHDEALSRVWKGSSEGQPHLGIGGFKKALGLVANEMDAFNPPEREVTGNPFLDGPSGAAPIPPRKPPPAPPEWGAPAPPPPTAPTDASSGKPSGGGGGGGMFKGMFGKGSKDKQAAEPDAAPVKRRGDEGQSGGWASGAPVGGGSAHDTPPPAAAHPNFEWSTPPPSGGEGSAEKDKKPKGMVGKMWHKYQEKKVEAKIKTHCGERTPQEVIVDSLRRMHFLYLAGYKYEHSKCSSEVAKKMLSNKHINITHMQRISTVLKEGARSCGGNSDNLFTKGMKAAKTMGSGVKTHPDRTALAGNLLWSFISLLRNEDKYPLEPTLADCVNEFIRTTAQSADRDNKAAKSLFMFADKMLEKATQAEEKRKKDIAEGERRMAKERLEAQKRLDKLKESEQY